MSHDRVVFRFMTFPGYFPLYFHYGHSFCRDMIRINKKAISFFRKSTFKGSNSVEIHSLLKRRDLANYVPTPHQKRVGVGAYCFWNRSSWRRRQCQHRRKTSCPLCNLNTLWNILMILGRNVDQDEMTCRIQG